MQIPIRKQLEQDAEEQDGDNSCKGHWQTCGQAGDVGGKGADQASFLPGREHSKYQAEDHRQSQRGQRQLGGRWKLFPNNPGHVAACVEGCAELSSYETAQEIHILLPKGMIQSQTRTQGFNLFRSSQTLG